MQDIETIRKLIEAEMKNKTDRKVRNIFFLCRSAGDFRSIYAIAGNNNQIFGVAFISDYNDVEIVI